MLSIGFLAVGPSGGGAYGGAYWSTTRDGSGEVPDALDIDTSVTGGETISGNVCWEVLASDAPKLMLWVFGSDDSEAWFSLVPR